MYSKREYLQIMKVMVDVVCTDGHEAHRRLTKKLQLLVREQPREYTQQTSDISRGKGPARATCLDVNIMNAEYNLLARGPKFVPSTGPANTQKLKRLEMNIETALNRLRKKP